jgi:hypothetical protein
MLRISKIRVSEKERDKNVHALHRIVCRLTPGIKLSKNFEVTFEDELDAHVIKQAIERARLKKNGKIN